MYLILRWLAAGLVNTASLVRGPRAFVRAQDFFTELYPQRRIVDTQIKFYTSPIWNVYVFYQAVPNADGSRWITEPAPYVVIRVNTQTGEVSEVDLEREPRYVLWCRK